MAVVRNVFFAQDADSGSSVGLGGVGSLPANTTPGSRPDIVVLVVESLRGATTGFVNGEEPSPTPVLDRLAGDGIAFSRFISNGFPSSEGFFALHTGLLPHPTRAATATFTGPHFDALPERLNRLGYYTTALWGGNPVMDNQLAWAQRWYDQVDYGLGANRWRYTKSRSDRETIEALIGHLHRGDQERPGQPQFIYAATAGMHEPFSAGEPDANYKMANRDGALPYDPVTMGDREVNYRERLREFDDALERLRVFLETRSRRDQTVLLVCGDHSVLLNEAVDLKMRTYPVDGFVWTGAVLHGAPSLIGPPRVADFPASQVDVMPTLLGLAGDSRVTMTMGMDLLAGTELRERQAVAVREGGFRLDRMNGSLLVNAENPEDWQATPEDWPEAADQAQELYEAVWSWAALLEENQHGPSRGDREGDQ
jgi:arylsulfatase A-like enzyme